MKDKLPAAVKNLGAWVDKILSDAAGKEWQLRFFIENFGLKDFASFYNELLPFVIDLNVEDKELFENYVAVFEKNKTYLEKAMEEHWLIDFLLNVLGDDFIKGRSADALIQVLKNIKSNTENISYSIDVYNG